MNSIYKLCVGDSLRASNAGLVVYGSLIYPTSFGSGGSLSAGGGSIYFKVMNYILICKKC